LYFCLEHRVPEELENCEPSDDLQFLLQCDASEEKVNYDFQQAIAQSDFLGLSIQSKSIANM
jgi:hypothetical protein